MPKRKSKNNWFDHKLKKFLENYQRGLKKLIQSLDNSIKILKDEEKEN